MASNNVANQNTADERQAKCWEFYVKELNRGIDNAYASAIKAGYGKDYSRNITLQDWWKDRKDNLRRKGMVSKAERNLDETLDIITINDEGKIDPQLLKIKVDVSKTIVTTLGKENYSDRREITGKDGKDLFMLIDDIDE